VLVVGHSNRYITTTPSHGANGLAHFLLTGTVHSRKGAHGLTRAPPSPREEYEARYRRDGLAKRLPNGVVSVFFRKVRTMAEKPTSQEIKEKVKKVQDAIEKHKRENKEENFTGLTPEEIEKKLKRANSPIIVSQGWGSTVPGGTVNYSLGVHNPDPTQANWLFAHVWVGSGNVDPDVGTFLDNVDPRFPRLTQPAFSGLTLAAGGSSTLSFALKVPDTAEKTNYIGNSCLMRFNWHDIGTYLDRGVFVFAVS
jgi:hypothetical protein